MQGHERLLGTIRFSKSNSVSPLSGVYKIPGRIQIVVGRRVTGPINAELTEGALLDEPMMTRLLSTSEPASVPSWGVTEYCH